MKRRKAKWYEYLTFAFIIQTLLPTRIMDWIDEEVLGIQRWEWIMALIIPRTLGYHKFIDRHPTLLGIIMGFNYWPWLIVATFAGWDNLGNEHPSATIYDSCDDAYMPRGWPINRVSVVDPIAECTSFGGWLFYAIIWPWSRQDLKW